MIKMGKIVLVILSLCIFESPLHAMGKPQRYMPSTTDRVVIMGVIAVPAVIIVGGLAALLYRWVTKEESHEHFYMRINRTYNDIFDRYKNTHIIHNKQLIASTTEAELIKYVSYATVLEATLHTVEADLRRLKDAQESLEEHMMRNGHKNNPILSEMRTLLNNIKDFITILEPIAQFWQQHKNFFRSYNKSTEIGLSYKPMIEHTHEKEFINKTVMACAVNAAYKVDYPYSYFVNKLKNDITDLASYKSKVHHYTFLYGRMEKLLIELKDVLDSIVGTSEYSNELYLKKQHELEQERIAIERQKAQAERDKAQALAQQAAAEREKVHAMYHQAAVEREKAQAIKEQTLVQLAQPKQQPQHIIINMQQPTPQAAAPQPIAQPALPVHAAESTLVPTAPAMTPPPSYDVTMFFGAIEDITPAALSRLDFHVPQLEQRYGLAEKAVMNGHSLISAALDARHLDTFNKVELITWLTNYGIKPTSADKQKAYQTGEDRIIQAVVYA